MKFGLAWILLTLPFLAQAQGNAASYGQGGGFGQGNSMGAMGGMAGGRINPDDANENRLIEYGKLSTPEYGDFGWFKKSAILTPGDRFEFKIDAKKGDVVFAGATSDAFDPALSVEDAKGKVLSKNDDREEGEQSPFIAYRFPEDGAYKLRVLSYRSVSGGKFEIRLKTLTPIDVRLGNSKYVLPEAPSRHFDLFRIPAKKGQIFDLGMAQQTRPNEAYPRPVTVIGPTGVSRQDFSQLPTPGGWVFRTKVDGDFYAVYANDISPQAEREIEARITEVIPRSMKTYETLNLNPTWGELFMAEFPVTKDQVVRTRVSGSYQVAVCGEGLIPFERPSNRDPNGRLAGPVFDVGNFSASDYVRVYAKAGTATIFVRGDTSNRKLQIENTDPLVPWESGGPIKDRLSIGETKFFRLRSTKSELTKVASETTSFLGEVKIFRLNGELANQLGGRGRPAISDNLYFPNAEDFIVTLSCVGDGGSGEFTLRRESVEPLPFSLGQKQSLSLTGGTLGLYAVNLEAGKRYELVMDRAVGVDFIDEAGTFIRTQAIDFSGTVVHYVVPQKSGRHRLWLRGAPGNVQFILREHVPPKLNP